MAGERKVDIPGITIRWKGYNCGDDNVGPCECLVYNSECEPYCFKFTGLLTQRENGDCARKPECVKEFGR